MKVKTFLEFSSLRKDDKKLRLHCEKEKKKKVLYFFFLIV